jgi:hypothetical protein
MGLAIIFPSWEGITLPKSPRLFPETIWEVRFSPSGFRNPNPTVSTEICWRLEHWLTLSQFDDIKERSLGFVKVMIMIMGFKSFLCLYKHTDIYRWNDMISEVCFGNIWVVTDQEAGWAKSPCLFVIQRLRSYVFEVFHNAKIFVRKKRTGVQELNLLLFLKIMLRYQWVTVASG